MKKILVCSLLLLAVSVRGQIGFGPRPTGGGKDADSVQSVPVGDTTGTLTDNYILKYDQSGDSLAWEVDASGGTTAYDDIANPDASGSIAFAAYTGTYTSSTANWGGLIIENTAADPTAGASLINLLYDAAGDAHGNFLRCYDNSGGDLKVTIGVNGAITTVGAITAATAITASAGAVYSSVGFDGTGAQDLDYGSGDVTDHTFITDGTGTGEVVLPDEAIDGTEVLDQTIKGDDDDSTAENFAFDDAYHVTSAESDSAYITIETLEDTAALRLLLAGGTMSGGIDMGDEDITNIERVECDTLFVGTIDLADGKGDTAVANFGTADPGRFSSGQVDAQFGDSSHGYIRIGNAWYGMNYDTTYNEGAFDLGHTMMFGNMGSPSIFEFVFIASDGSVRMAIPSPAAGKGTNFIRSGMFAGPVGAAQWDDDIVLNTYWGFDSLDMATDVDGADLGVQNDVQILGELFVDSIRSAGQTELNIDQDVGVQGDIAVTGTVDGKDIATNAAMLNEAETIGSNWDNTANPWADNEVDDNITIDLATLATTVTIADNESTDESNAVIFTPGGAQGGGDLALESDGDFNYNPSSGLVTATAFSGDGALLTDVGVSSPTIISMLCRNTTGSTIAKMKAVYISGATGGRALISLSDNTDAAKYEVLGLVMADINNNSNGLVLLAGEYDNFNTSSFSDGDALYLTTAGDLSATQPTSGSVQHVGNVSYDNASVGSIVMSDHQETFIAAASSENINLRMGDAGGSNSIMFHDYANLMIGYITSDGDLVMGDTTTGDVDVFYYFATNGSYTTEFLKWDDGDAEFQLSDDLDVTGTIISDDTLFYTFILADPDALYTIDTQWGFDPKTADAITIRSIYVTLDADPSTEMAFSIVFCDVGVGWSNPTTIDDTATVAGVTDVTGGFGDATVPAGKKLFFLFDADPDDAITQADIKIGYTVD